MEKHADDKSFKKEVLESELPVLVDFWAAWCGPCMAIGPTIEQIAREYDGKIKVCKVNVDNAPATAQKYCVQSIPTLSVFVKGKEVDREVGGLPKASIEKFFEKYLTKNK
jgi:thioredoxin 1